MKVGNLYSNKQSDARYIECNIDNFKKNSKILGKLGFQDESI